MATKDTIKYSDKYSKLHKETRSAIRKLKEDCKTALKVEDDTGSFYLMVGAVHDAFTGLHNTLAKVNPVIDEMLQADAFYLMAAYSFSYPITMNTSVNLADGTVTSSNPAIMLALIVLTLFVALLKIAREEYLRVRDAKEKEVRREEKKNNSQQRVLRSSSAKM